MNKTHEHPDGKAVHQERVIDPVCGMEVSLDPRLVHPYLGRNYWFCSEDCRIDFQNHPGRYVHGT